jgi:membrane protein
MFKKYLTKIRNSWLYINFRKLRLLIHYSGFLKRLKNFSRHYFLGIYNRIDEHHIFLLGGGLAFSLFICIIPFILIIFFLLGTILDSYYMQSQINYFIDTIIPYYAYAEFVKTIIFSRINEVIEYKTLAGILGVFGLLFAASGLFSSMRTILNTVFGVDTDVNFIMAKLRDFAMVLMVILIFFFSTILMPVLDILRQAATQWEFFSFFSSGIFEYFLFSAISFLIIFIVFTVLYMTVPLRKLTRKTSLMSALWAAILWEGAKQVFGYYIYNFSAFGRIYGAYALMVVVAFWIYYSSIVFIIGAEIGRLYHERKMVKEQLTSA